MNISKTLLVLALGSSLLVSQKATAWDEKTVTYGVIAGALTKLVSYALVNGANVTPNKAVTPSLLVGLATVYASEGKHKSQEFIIGAATWALLTLFIKDQENNRQ
jgi:hypothetical protein